MSNFLWSPSTSSIATNPITKLSEWVSKSTSKSIENFSDLHTWSIENPGEFWARVWDESEIIGHKGVNYYSPAPYFPDAKFFSDATVNTAENLLAKGEDNEIAIIAILEDGERTELTWGALRERVNATAAAMRSENVKVGDCVVAWTPNVIETVIFTLAALSIGAVVSTASPDFAPSAVIDRFGQINPVFLLASKSYTYGGKTFDCLERLSEIVKGLPSLKKIVLISKDDSEYETFDSWISDFVSAPAKYEPLPFDHPGFVLFSSGTTGKPKCMIHRAAGILLKLRSEQRFNLNLSEADKIFFFTTCGWMMWNWLVYVLGSGATIVLFDGNPMFPNQDRLIEIAEREKVTVLGLSAKYIETIRKSEISARSNRNLELLRMVISTGSVLAPESFDYIYEFIKDDIHLVSMSGGTDICGCFISGIPTMPVYRGEIQGACLGMATAVFDEKGNSAAINEKGELVCTVPFPSMPIGFWGDIDGTKYKSAYFEGFPNVWTHGDFAARSEHGGFILFGRSDATLNSKGVRIGTAEIYRIAETFPEITEAMAVSQDWDNDTRVILFVTLKSDVKLDKDLVSRIKSRLRSDASPRHVPDLIIAAPELPRTKSNKLVELAVTDVINGRMIRNRDALANPNSLEWFKNIAELSN
ncbi:MAG: acetoacetate--CoA ligase [Acidobacteria bacterium]|nr:acetoacetate--CoA ligase [Acidobacteriota bacterium]